MKKHKSISVKIFIEILSLSLLILFIIGMTADREYKKLFEDREIQYHLKITNNTKEQFNILIDMADDTMYALTKNETILQALAQGTTEDATKTVESLIENVKEINSNINGVHILGVNGYRCSTTSGFAKGEQENFYKQYLAQYQCNIKRSGVWTDLHTTGDNQYLSSTSYICPVFNSNTKELYGIIALDISYESIHKLFTTSSIHTKDRAVIVNEDGKILLQYPLATSYDEILEKYPEVLKKNVTMETKLYKKDVIIVSEKIDVADWRIIRFVFKEDVTRGFQEIFKDFNVLIIITLLIAILYTTILTNSMTKPIKELSNICNRIKEGDFTAHVKVSRDDEFGQLGNTFNGMILQINTSFDKERTAQKRKSEMEFQILQAQINPHFLYNTLDSIKWLAVMQGVENIAEMSIALINLLKYNLGKGEGKITLKEEVESVKNYIVIQKYRYSDLFEFTTSIDEDALNCQVLRFILQPLVENCIIHGFNEEKTNYRIHIAAKIFDDKLHIKVIDNGSGMNEECKLQLNQGNIKTTRFSNIGINNIRERIKLYFGEEYDLIFDSKSDVATIAEIILPFH
ncbi:MAG: sensor histidine kinase [Lachnospiraceae bacterium]